MHEALIQTISSFIDIGPRDAVLLRRFFRHRRLEQGEHFLLAGDVCHEAGYVTSGLVRYSINHDGEVLTYAFAAEHEFVCDYPSFLVAKPSEHDIEALEPTEMLAISFDDLQQLYQQLEHGERFGRLVAEQLFTHVLDQLTSLYRDPPAIRYQQFLLQFPHLLERIPQYSIASYIGVKPQSLSRIRRRFRTTPLAEAPDVNPGA